jgi:putative membrane protein
MDAEDLKRILALTRPDPALLKVYLLRSFVTALGLLVAVLVAGLRVVKHKALDLEKLPLPVLLAAGAGLYLVCYVGVLIYYVVRYRTMRFRFEEDGLAQKWGLFFRKDRFLAFARIQDINVTRGVLERMFGLGTVIVETASAQKGGAEAVEGLRDYELIRDFLQWKMRGSTVVPAAAEPIVLLNAIRDEVRALRLAIDGRP